MFRWLLEFSECDADRIITDIITKRGKALFLTCTFSHVAVRRGEKQMISNMSTM